MVEPERASPKGHPIHALERLAGVFGFILTVLAFAAENVWLGFLVLAVLTSSVALWALMYRRDMPDHLRRAILIGCSGLAFVLLSGAAVLLVRSEPGQDSTGAPRLLITLDARNTSRDQQGLWAPTVAADVGETVDFLIFVENRGETDLTDVTVRSNSHVGKSLQLVANSVRWIYVGRDGSTQDLRQQDKNLFEGNVSFGDWKPGGGFYLRYTTIVKPISQCNVVVREQAVVYASESPDRRASADLTLREPLSCGSD